MNKLISKQLFFIVFTCVLIMQSFIINASAEQVSAKIKNINEFHNDAQRYLKTRAVLSLIGEYAFDATMYVIRKIHKSSSPRFQELLKTFDTNIPIKDPTCSHKVANLLDSENPNKLQSLRLTDLYTGGGVPMLPDVIASSGPLADYTVLAVVKKCAHNHDTRQLLFNNTCERSENGYTVTISNDKAAIVEVEPDKDTLRLAGFLPPQSNYCSDLSCWQLMNCQHDK